MQNDLVQLLSSLVLILVLHFGETQFCSQACLVFIDLWITVLASFRNQPALLLTAFYNFKSVNLISLATHMALVLFFKSGQCVSAISNLE